MRTIKNEKSRSTVISIGYSNTVSAKNCERYSDLGEEGNHRSFRSCFAMRNDTKYMTIARWAIVSEMDMFLRHTHTKTGKRRPFILSFLESTHLFVWIMTLDALD